MAKVNLGRVGFVMQGNHSTSKTYKRLDCVTSNGVMYSAKEDVPTGIAINNETYWQKIFDGEEVMDSKMERYVIKLTKNGETYSLTDIDNQAVTFNSLYNTLRDLSKYVVCVYGNSKLRPQYVSTNEMLFIGLDRASSSSKVLRMHVTPTAIRYETFELAEKSYVDTELNKKASAATMAAFALNLGNLEGDVDELKSDIARVEQHNATDIIPKFYDYSTKTNNGITLAWNENKTIGHVVRTNGSGYGNLTFFNSTTSMPDGIEAGRKYYVEVTTTNPKVVFQMFFYDANGANTVVSFTENNVITVPVDCVGMNVRIRCNDNVSTYDDYIAVAILNAPSNANLSDRIADEQNRAEQAELSSNERISKIIYPKDASKYVSNRVISLADITEDGRYVISTNWTVTDAPDDLTVSALTVERFSVNEDSNGFVKQIVESIVTPVGNKRYMRISNSSGVFGKWVDISSFTQEIKNNYTNEYVTNHYTNTYTITATPTITSDVNNYLAPSGDVTDRYTDIQTMLETTGVCRLGAGNYYVSRPINVRNSQMLIGAGKGTIIYSRSNFVGEYIVKMESYSTVKDLQIRGIATVTVQETVGDKHGILIEGNADGDANDIPVRMTIENVEISRLNGGAITFRNTGLSTACSAMVSDVTIFDCDAGINVAYFSEFNHFNNIRANNCYYGCVNNGGNNVFTNCDFSGNKVGMLMDNSNNQSPNNTHGSAVACVFDHSNGNNGYGLKVLNCKNGYTFVGCQFFYSKILFEDSDGLVVANSIFGSANTDIIVNGGGTVLFTGNMHGSQPTSITITDNDKVHFVNCFVRSTGEAVSN